MKKIVIFGSTGMTGLCAVEAAIKKGLKVRAFVRDPSKMPDHLKDKVEIFKGNVLEPDSVNDAVEGTDGVVIALGTRNALEPTSDMSEGTKNILEAMRAKNIKVVSACLSAFLFWAPEKVPPRFVDLNEDHKRMYQALKDSGLNYIAVYPPHIAGLKVRAFVRDPSKMPDHLKDKVEIFKGNVLEPDSVNDAVEGTDGVVIALGTRNALEPTSDMSEGTKNILEAMRAKNIKVVSACLSAFLFWAPEKVPPRFVDLNEDHKRMYQALKDSGLNYIAVYPPHIADEPSREILVTVNPENGPGRSISKWDLGSFLVDSLSDPKYYKAVIGIANAPKA